MITPERNPPPSLPHLSRPIPLLDPSPNEIDLRAYSPPVSHDSRIESYDHSKRYRGDDQGDERRGTKRWNRARILILLLERNRAWTNEGLILRIHPKREYRHE